MTQWKRIVMTGVLALCAWPLVAGATFYSPKLSFEEGAAGAREMFQYPAFSSSTRGLDTEGFANDAIRSGEWGGSDGSRALNAYFSWLDAADPYAWVRLTTFNGAERPNPTVDLRGKIRFTIANAGNWSDGDVGLCVAIRETGVDTSLMANGGTTGTIEFVGVSTALSVIEPGEDDTIESIPVGDDVVWEVEGVIRAISWGPDRVLQTVPAGDDVAKAGYVRAPDNGAIIPIPAVTVPVNLFGWPLVEVDLATGQISFDGGPKVGGVAALSGDGVLSTPNDKAVLEALVITNDVNDTGTTISLFIDELQFDSPVADATPPPSIQGPVFSTDTQVQVKCLQGAVPAQNATLAELYLNDVSLGTAVPDGLFVATFSGLTLDAGDVLTARQQANGLWSEQSSATQVYGPGTALAENFDNYVDQAHLETVWQQSNPANELRFLLSRGGASSCENFVVSDYRTAPAVSKLYYSLGSVDGTDEEPLLVTYRYKHNINNANARARFELAPELAKTHGAVGFAFTNGVGGPHGTQYTTMTNSPSPILNGYTADYFGYDYAATGVDRVPGVWHKMQIEVKTDVVNFYIDDQLVNVPHDAEGNPITSNGAPLYVDGVPRINKEAPFKYIILGTGFSNNGPAEMYDDISVTLGDTPIPFGPPNPVEAPTLGTLVPSATVVELTNVDNAASLVTVFSDAMGGVIGSAAGPFVDNTASVTVVALVVDDTITATQTVGGIESCLSTAATVAVPAPTLQIPLEVGQTSVTVENVHPLASIATVYVNAGAYSASTGGATSVPVVVPALMPGDVVKASQTISDIEGPFSLSFIVANYLVINELQYDDTGTDDHQFIELYNAGPAPMDISGYKIETGDSVARYTVTIPAGTTIASGGFWTVGQSAVASLPGAVVDLIDDNLNLGDSGFATANGKIYVAVRNPADTLLDAAAVETNKATPVFPAEILLQIGPGIWGNTVMSDGEALASDGRFVDGADTDNNGRDFGILPATPGYSNAMPDRMPYFEDFNSLASGANVPSWYWTYVPARAYNPAVADAVNPAAIPASPDGGNVMIAWDETGGGNANFMSQQAKEDFSLETYIYIPPVFTPNGYEETKIGIRGTTDGLHNFDYYNGSTGLAWLLQRTTTNQRAWLIDENDGNDGTPSTPICATVIGSITIGTDPNLTGWQRLLLETQGDKVRGIFGGTYGSRSDGIQFVGTHESPGPGGVWLSYRESMTGTGIPDNRPPTLDAFSLKAPPAAGDIDGDGSVDLDDYVRFAACLNGPDVTTPPIGCSVLEFDAADIDADGDVDLADFADFQVIY